MGQCLQSDPNIVRGGDCKGKAPDTRLSSCLSGLDRERAGGGGGVRVFLCFFFCVCVSFFFAIATHKGNKLGFTDEHSETTQQLNQTKLPGPRECRLPHHRSLQPAFGTKLILLQGALFPALILSLTPVGFHGAIAEQTYSIWMCGV